MTFEAHLATSLLVASALLALPLAGARMTRQVERLRLSIWNDHYERVGVAIASVFLLLLISLSLLAVTTMFIELPFSKVDLALHWFRQLCFAMCLTLWSTNRKARTIWLAALGVALTALLLYA